MITAADIHDQFRAIDLNAEERAYLDFCAERIAYTVNLIQGYCAAFSVQTVLDVGPHFLTTCLKRLIRPAVRLSTLGWPNTRLVPEGLVERHIDLDLNEAEAATGNVVGPPFDLIMCGEVIEHLYSAPSHLLRFFLTLLKRPDGLLIIQTPNAVSLSKRRRMLLGRHPFEPIRENRGNPGHFREYTMSELIAYGAGVGLRVHQRKFCDYWRPSLPERWLGAIHPPFREGLTVTFLT